MGNRQHFSFFYIINAFHSVITYQLTSFPKYFYNIYKTEGDLNYMKAFILSSCTYMAEAIAELLLVISFLGKKKKSLLSPLLLLLPLCGLVNNFLFTFIPNVFGWFMTLPMSVLFYCLILHIPFSSGIFPFLLSYVTYGLIEAITIILLPVSISASSSVKNDLLLTCIICAFCILISLLPLNRLHTFINSGNLIVKLVLSYISMLYLVTIAISKIDSLNAIAVFPMTVTFMIILLLADIMVLNQQRTITIQQQDIKDYQTYEPMAHDLISDILGKQHDFNNQMNAIRMLPYTYKDYDSLSDAIANYSTFLEEEFNESELLKINLPVVAGFVFSKIKEAEQKGRLISVKIKNRSLITPVPEYDLIRILGILIDNAIEATEPGHTFSLILDSRNDHVRIQTKNEGGEISSELRKKMFVRGYSTKTSTEVRTSRGQGLPNLKKLVDHYNGKIYLDNETFHEHTWICFTVEL